MKQLRRTLTLAAVLGLLALPGLAQGRGPIARAEGRGFPVLRCLHNADLDLTETQKADIKAILEAARPTIQAGQDKVRADRQKLHADIEAGADKSVLGQDVLDLHADLTAVHAEVQSLKDQIASKLTPDQKARIGNCLAARRPGPFHEHAFD